MIDFKPAVLNIKQYNIVFKIESLILTFNDDKSKDF
jgi:hypothetical protein